MCDVSSRWYLIVIKVTNTTISSNATPNVNWRGIWQVAMYNIKWMIIVYTTHKLSFLVT